MKVQQTGESVAMIVSNRIWHTSSPSYSHANRMYFACNSEMLSEYCVMDETSFWALIAVSKITELIRIVSTQTPDVLMFDGRQTIPRRNGVKHTK